MLAWPPKDPNEVLDYQVDWSDRLAGDTILTSAWTVPSGIVRDSDDFSESMTTIWLSGGTDGATYELLNRIATVGGRIMDQTISIQLLTR